MFRSFKLTATVFLLVLAGACGTANDTTTVSDPCPAVTGDKHLTLGTANPGGYKVMLHTVGFACPTAGENTFALYPMAKMEMKAPAFDAAMDTTSTTGVPGPNTMLALKTVTITMPSMGHGPAQAPVISKDKPNQFSATFQMPGDWQAVLTFVAEGVTTTTQTVTLDFTVK